MMALSIVCCAIFTTLGLAVSYTHRLPSGPTIILLSGAVYLAVAVTWRLLTRRRTRPRLSAQNLDKSRARR